MDFSECAQLPRLRFRTFDLEGPLQGRDQIDAIEAIEAEVFDQSLVGGHLRQLEFEFIGNRLIDAGTDYGVYGAGALSSMLTVTATDDQVLRKANQPPCHSR